MRKGVKDAASMIDMTNNYLTYFYFPDEQTGFTTTLTLKRMKTSSERQPIYPLKCHLLLGKIGYRVYPQKSGGNPREIEMMSSRTFV